MSTGHGRFQLAALFITAAFLLISVEGFCASKPLTGSHLSDLTCGDCHPGTTGEDSYSRVIKDCDECHDAKANIHPIGIKPKDPVPEGFALSAEGTLLCRSCHMVHGGDKDSGYLSTAGNGYAKGRSAFCANCHGSKNVRTNPHSARRGDSRCTFCHTSVPHDPAEAAKSIRTEVVRLCDFCHGAVAQNHPRNIDPTLVIPEELPRDEKGEWTCVTCHDPHGTTSTTHYIRVPYARYMERGKTDNPHRGDYFACKACHTESTETAIRIPGLSLRYKGDINFICISCHVTEKGHHPTGVPLPAQMLSRAEKSPTMMPFDEEGRITCVTCHDNQCESGEFEMIERDYDSKSYNTELCWNCHDRQEYAKVSPHTEDLRQCIRCHETTPGKGIDPSFMTVPLMVCLHCHDVKPHPVGKGHLEKPSEIIKVDPSLPLSKDGRVTCITCHDPHANTTGYPNRLRYKDPGKICSLCHWKG